MYRHWVHRGYIMAISPKKWGCQMVPMKLIHWSLIHNISIFLSHRNIEPTGVNDWRDSCWRVPTFSCDCSTSSNVRQRGGFWSGHCRGGAAGWLLVTGQRHLFKGLGSLVEVGDLLTSGWASWSACCARWFSFFLGVVEILGPSKGDFGHRNAQNEKHSDHSGFGDLPFGGTALFLYVLVGSGGLVWIGVVPLFRDVFRFVSSTCCQELEMVGQWTMFGSNVFYLHPIKSRSWCLTCLVSSFFSELVGACWCQETNAALANSDEFLSELLRRLETDDGSESSPAVSVAFALRWKTWRVVKVKVRHSVL